MKKNKIDKIYNLVGIFDKDFWDIKKCGLKNIEKCMENHYTSYGEIDFRNIRNETIKREIKYYIFNKLISFKGNLDSLRANNLIYFKWTIKFLEGNCGKVSSLFEVNTKDTDNFREFLIRNNIRVINKKKDDATKFHNAPIVNTLKRIKVYLLNEYNAACGNVPDILYVKDLKLSSHRINPSRDIKTINFISIENEYNKKILKDYIKYLCYETEISLSFIYSKLTSIKEFMNKFVDKRIDELTRKDIEIYKEYLLKKEIESSTYNKRIIDISNFFEYGIQKGIWSHNNIYWEYDLLDSSLKIRAQTVEQGVIDQILNNKDSFCERDFAMFLILYCCGMRISEVCTLTMDSIKRDDKGFYIVFYCQKMKKEASNPIPKYLFEYLEKYSESVRKKFGDKQKFLFTKKDGSVILANTYKESMKKIIRELGIRNSDGSDYIFRPHEYRHTFATSLLERNIPFSVVQKLLHHNSPEMSLVYTQLSDYRKREKYVEFVNILGKKSTNLFEENKNNARIYEVQWLKNNLKAQALPNGFCSLPVSLGICPYSNACLTCEYFKSTKGHLQILKKQLIRTEALIEILKEKDLEEQLKINYEVKRNLERIITSIEKGDKNAVT